MNQSPLVKQVFTGGDEARAIAEQARRAIDDRLNVISHLYDIRTRALNLAEKLDEHAKAFGMQVK